MLAALDLNDWIAPIVFVLGGILVGMVLERLSLNLFSRLSGKLPWISGDTVNPLRGVIFWFFVLMGFYLATYCADALKDNVLFAIRRVIFVVAMLQVIRYAANIAIALITFYVGRSSSLKSLPSTSIFVNLARIVIFGLGLLVILQSLGVSVMPIVTALGVGGLAISLALQDTLANFFAGIHIIVSRQIQVGDFVRLEGGQEGKVKDIGWRNTTLKQNSNNLVIVPNTKMAANILTNMASPIPDFIIKVEAGVPYESDLEHVETIVKEVAAETFRHVPNIKSGGDPAVRFHTFAESGITFSTILQVKAFIDPGLVRHDFMKRLHARFKTEGIEMPYPQRVVHVENAPVFEVKSIAQNGSSGTRASKKTITES